ncbi:MAG: hypothetical protein RML56_09615 [Burkholderiales bacterium]|nr:hypothetical protein [Burkholderiales bacterium]
MRRTAILAAALASSVFATTTALAHGRHHGHVRIRVVIGTPVVVYRWIPPPPPRYVVLHPPPRGWVATAPVYVARDADRAAAGDSWWYYYCPQARAYYPYVRHCPGGWQRVPPQPSD